MKPATLLVFIGQLAALAVATESQHHVNEPTRYSDPTRDSVLSVLRTAIPSSVQSALVAHATSFSFEYGCTDSEDNPDWYQNLPDDVKSLIPEMYSQAKANSASQSSANPTHEAATCQTTSTILTTVTFTVTGHSSSDVPVMTPPVNSLPSPSHPVPSAHSEPAPGSSVSESKSSWISSVPEPTKPATGSSVPGIAPHTSGHSGFPTAPFPTGHNTTAVYPTGSGTMPVGTGSATTSGPLEVPTNGQGKIDINRIAMALVAVGCAFLAL